jgi:hypothetical protein
MSESQRIVLVVGSAAAFAFACLRSHYMRKKNQQKKTIERSHAYEK